MSGCFDFTCAHCGGKIRWAGTLDDSPPCPRCGEYLSADTIDQAKVLLEQVETEAAELRKAIVTQRKNIELDMPCVQYPGGDYDHDTLELEGE